MASQPPFGRVREHPRLHDPPTHSLLPSLSLSRLSVCLSVYCLCRYLCLLLSLSHLTSLPLPRPADLTSLVAGTPRPHLHSTCVRLLTRES